MSPRIVVKVCGITEGRDAQEAVHLGVDALGFDFRAGSPRCVDPDLVHRIVARLPAFVTTVGVFADEPLIRPRPRGARRGAAQFHGTRPRRHARGGPVPVGQGVPCRPELRRRDLLRDDISARRTPGGRRRSALRWRRARSGAAGGSIGNLERRTSAWRSTTRDPTAWTSCRKPRSPRERGPGPSGAACGVRMGRAPHRRGLGVRSRQVIRAARRAQERLTPFRLREFHGDDDPAPRLPVFRAGDELALLHGIERSTRQAAGVDVLQIRFGTITVLATVASWRIRSAQDLGLRSCPAPSDVQGGNPEDRRGSRPGFDGALLPSPSST